MTELPHDISDLHLAPVVLELDRRISELSALDDGKLALKVAMESDEPDWSAELRRDAILRTVAYLLDLHGWELSWDDRGIRVSHGGRSLVLGLPTNVGRYVSGAAGG